MSVPPSSSFTTQDRLSGTSSAHPAHVASPGEAIDQRVSTMLLQRLRRLEYGRLRLRVGDGAEWTCVGLRSGPAADIRIHRLRPLAWKLAARGAIGFAESYMDGDWDSDALGALLESMVLNQAALLDQSTHGKRWLHAFDVLRHRLNHNDRRNSRRNIAAHYDLGNAFYKLWLDPGMTYSSALFAAADESLEAAQTRKYQHMLDRLKAAPGAHILEIGCGWGGFALHAARAGYRVTGVTLSREQLAEAQARVQAEGLGERVELRLQDYRDVRETFDHAVSIEMFEAVGEAYWGAWFNTLRERVRRGGCMAAQIITVDSVFYADYRRSTDFIRKYIFPGGHLPSIPAFAASASEHGLQTSDLALHGVDYANTLQRWDRSFQAQHETLQSMGYDRRFQRMWRYYLCACEGAFRARHIDLMQVTLRHA